ncbi:hypothetical protein EVA_06083 [gut metagenome]|uniref:Uncharacterized protein n=1 Tax=gut metagenome TaxID=749906 RepID=J9GFU4_9ZZZZ
MGLDHLPQGALRPHDGHLPALPQLQGAPRHRERHGAQGRARGRRGR